VTRDHAVAHLLALPKVSFQVSDLLLEALHFTTAIFLFDFKNLSQHGAERIDPGPSLRSLGHEADGTSEVAGVLFHAPFAEEPLIELAAGAFNRIQVLPVFSCSPIGRPVGPCFLRGAAPQDD
jgi:hypothetical protein